MSCAERHGRAGAGADGARHRPRRRGVLPDASRSARRLKSPSLVGATPVFVDVRCRDLQHRSRRACKSAIAMAQCARPASPRRSSRSICSACRRITTRLPRSPAAEGLLVLDDAAQGFGATYHGRTIGTFGDMPPRPASSRQSRSAATATAARSSPTTTSSPKRSSRACACTGSGTDKYDNVRIGIDRPPRHHPGGGADREAQRSSRTRSRRASASPSATTQALDDVAIVPQRADGPHAPCGRSTRSASSPVSAMRSAPRSRREGIPTAIYYPKPLHRQTALPALPAGGGRSAGNRSSRRRGDQPSDARPTWTRRRKIGL